MMLVHWSNCFTLGGHTHTHPPVGHPENEQRKLSILFASLSPFSFFSSFFSLLSVVDENSQELFQKHFLLNSIERKKGSVSWKSITPRNRHIKDHSRTFPSNFTLFLYIVRFPHHFKTIITVEERLFLLRRKSRMIFQKYEFNLDSYRKFKFRKSISLTN